MPEPSPQSGHPVHGGATSDRQVAVHDDAATSRFVLTIDGDEVSHATYRVDDDVVTIPHVETVAHRRGNGYAELLMDGVVEAISANRQRIRPLCPFAAEYVRDRPRLHELAVR